MASTPFRPEDITAEWLGSMVGRDVSGFEMEQIGVGVGLLGRLYRITLQGDGSPASVVAKFPTLDEGARMNVVAPLRFYEKEVTLYSDTSVVPVATPRVYCAEFDRESGDFVLLLEDCGDRRMEDQISGCPVNDAEIAIDAMAALHGKWWNNDFSSLPWMPMYADPPYPQVIAGMYKQSWPRAQEVIGDHISPAMHEFGDRYEELVPWFMEVLGEGERTFCHGDFRLDNLFYGTKPDHAPLTVVDWQICFRGVGGYDLGYFISQSLTTDARRGCESVLIDRYVDALSVQGITYSRDKVMDDYRRTIAYCFIYPVVASGQIELTNDRMLQLLRGMFDRAVQAIEDTKALDALP